MNGKDLPRDHGYPTQLVNLGHIGIHRVKWLQKIKFSNTPSTKLYKCNSYLGFAPDITFENDLSNCPPSRLDQAPIIHKQPITSSVCNPPQNDVTGMKGATYFTFTGVSWSSSGCKVGMVDVSVDGGESWMASELHKSIEQMCNHHWKWTQFSRTIDCLAGGSEGEVEVWREGRDGYHEQGVFMEICVCLN